jgi:hypothetical protein
MPSPSTKDLISHAVFMLAVLLLANHRVLLSGYPYGDDWIYELVRLVQFSAALAEHQIPPFWANDTYAGYGSPVFIFYSPLYLLLGHCWLQTGVEVVTAAHLSIMLLQLACMMAITGIFSEINYFERVNSLESSKIAIAVFMFSPYIIYDFMVRNAGAELTALYLSPLVILAGIKTYRNNKYGLLYLTFSISLIILSHNLTALTLSALVLFSSVIMLFFRKNYFALIIITSLLLAIGATSWFWYPALSMKELVSIGNMTTDKFDFRSNYINLSDMFDYKNPKSTGPLTFIILSVALYSIWRGSVTKALIWILLILALVFIFLQTRSSIPIWETIPFMELFQFPYRMMGPLSLTLALLLGLGYSRINFQYKFIVLLLLVITNSLYSFSLYKPFSEEVTQHLAEIVSPEIIKLNSLPTTVSDEYLPISANKEARLERGITDELLHNSSDNQATSLSKNEYDRKEVRLDEHTGTILTFRTWHFPTWEVRLNEIPIPHYPDKDGLLTVDIPAGPQLITIHKVQPPSRNIGFVVSTISIMLVFLVLFFISRRNDST